ncbi:hypothetical protein MBLNU459_g1734t1 [Dothideomycetes sp. NU459]
MSPEWLPDVENVHLKCIITLRIYDPSGRKKILVQESKNARLTAFAPENEELRFLIDVKEPFIVELNKLLANTNNSEKSDCARQWRKIYAASVVSFSISFLNPTDAAQLLSRIDPQFTSAELPEECELRANWKNLPTCPPSTRIHRLFRTHQGSPRHLDYSLDFDMVWEKPEQTPLVASNRAYREADLQSQAEDISSMLPTQEETVKHRITYIYEGGTLQARSIVSDNLKCTFCNSKHPSFRRLHFHYLASHDHFSFEVVREPVAENVVNVKIYIHLADKQYERASNNVSDEREIHWIRPTRPFDLDAYLEGADTWTNDKATARKATRDQIAAPRARLPSVGRHVKAPEQVKELPQKRRKKHVVPKISGVTLFRTVSKRRVRPGEELSESDDDVDVPWLKMGQGARPLPNLLGHAREFAALYDDYMDAEDLAGDTFVADAVLRFTRAYMQRLAGPDLLPQYVTKLSQLREDDLIPKGTEKHCIELLDTYRSVEQIVPPNGNENGDAELVIGNTEDVLENNIERASIQSEFTVRIA